MRPALLEVAPLVGQPREPQVGPGVGRVTAEKALPLVFRIAGAALRKKDFGQAQPRRIGIVAAPLNCALQFRDGRVRLALAKDGSLVIGPARLSGIERFRLGKAGPGFVGKFMGKQDLP